MTWIPTQEFLHGRLLKPFLPFDKHPTLKNDNFKNLYVGDEVYIFETKDDKWARGYTLTRPFPHDFTITSVNLDDLPGLNIKVVVFPLKYVKVIERLPLNLMEVTDEYNNINVSETLAPTLKESEQAQSDAIFGYRVAAGGAGGALGSRHGTRAGVGIDTSDGSKNRSVIPPLPFDTFTFTEDLVSEITYAMNLLTSHIFALYSIGEFRLFNKLSDVYRGLDENRVKLTSNTLTEYETQVAKETTTFLLSTIPKKLASKAARLNERSYDLDNKNTDISAYKAVLARDTFDGSLVSLKNASPAQLALNQQLCALYPKFPINAHYNHKDFVVAPSTNEKLVHEPPSHILVDFKSVSGSSSYQPSGFAGMIAYLYIRNTKKRLTEAFAVHTESVDDLVFVEKISAALFRNIPASEVENNRVFLVAVLTEEINLTTKDTFLPQITRLKKGVAAGVTDITRIFPRNQGSLASGQAHQFSIKLFGSFLSKKKFDTRHVENNGWGELVDRIISGSNEGIAVNPRAEKLVVSVKEFKHQLMDHDGEVVQDVSSDNNVDSRSEPIAKIKPIFFDPLAENYERLYLKMGKLSVVGETHKDSFLTVEITAPNDPSVSFAKASNQIEKSSWQFVSVLSGEVVGEIVKVNGIVSRSPSKKLSSKQDSIEFSLYANGILIGRSETLYKDGYEIVELNKKPWYTIDFHSPGSSPPVAQVQIHTEYIGKTFNTELCIENILQHERLVQEGPAGIDELHKSLVEFCKLDIYNVVRFFTELLSSILHNTDSCLENSQLPYSEMLLDAAFKATVYLLDTLFGRQDQYLYMFDTFIAENPIPTKAGVFLLNKMADIFTQAQSNWTSLSRSVCRNIALVIRLALYPLKVTCDAGAYTSTLEALFKAASFFVGLESDVLINDQILVIEIPDFVLAFEAELDQRLLLDLVLNFIESIGTRGLGIDEDATSNKFSLPATKDHKIIITKLLLMQRLFASDLAHDVANIHTLASKCVVWCMEVFLGALDIEGTRLAASVMNCVCDLLWKNIAVPGVDEVCFSLVKHLGALSRTFIRYNKFTRSGPYFKPKKSFTKLFQRHYPFKEIITDSIVGEESVVEVLVEIVSIFVYVARIGQKAAGPGGFYEINKVEIANDFFDPIKCTSNNGLSEDFLTILSGIQIMRLGKYFPEDKWLSLYASIAEGCLSAIELLVPSMLAHFIPDIDTPEVFDRSLWGSFFRTLFKLGTLPPVSVEHLSTIPRKACHQITGTMRDRIAGIINETWDALAWESTEEDLARFNLTKFGGFQVEFIGSDYAILQELMLFALQRNNACQTVAVKMIWSILVSEYILSDSIVDVERECLIGLHDIYNRTAYKPGSNEQSTFIERLRTTIRLGADDEALGLTLRFISNISGFLEVLNDLNQVPVGPEFEDDRTFHKLNINAYLKNANKPELLHSFISQMYEENLRKSDYIQAALCLELLASTYTWDHHVILPASYRPKFPEQTSFERKEALIKMIAQNYIKGNNLERATDTYNELLEAYNEYTYDLKSFAYVHQKLAKLYLDLESSDKLSPSYYRVAYIGAGFPANIRGKEQIYEGLPFEHITSIHERLLNLYPGARIITDDQQAQELRKKIQTGRYLHVNAVEPVNEISDKILNTSIGVRQYARNKNLRFFSTTRKIPGSTSVFDLWTEEITYETQVSFPTLMKRSEIKETSVVRLSPLENAIRIIINKNNELVQLESMLNMAVRDKTDHNTLLNDLSRHLAGTVDSPVNGGVGQFRAYFLDPRYDGKADYAYNIRLLKNAFYDLTMVLSRCLHLHGKLIGHSMRPSHDALVELYKQNFKDEIDLLNISTNYDALPYNHKVSAAEAARGKNASSSVNGTILGDSASTIGGSTLHRTSSRDSRSSKTSNVSANSGVTNVSEPSVATSTTRSLFGGKQRRTALNWKRG
ncbi:hypothetical protein JCM33374_g3202 [Metschnikowia sp. JCM 33374]|nr:hypothetical protein JCM33374_g3202 [Metschnikowia sp. JCM 33374]